jgi:hypothetical protein
MGMGMMGGQPGFDAGQCSCLMYSILHITHVPSFTLHLLSYLPSVISHHLLSPTTSSLPLPPLSHYLLSPTTSSLPLPPLSHYLLSLPPPLPSSLTLTSPLSCVLLGAAYRLEKDLLTMRKHESVGESEEKRLLGALFVVCQFYCHMKPQYGSYKVGIIKCTCPPNSASFSLLCVCVSSSSTGDRYPDQIGQEVDLSK